MSNLPKQETKMALSKLGLVSGRTAVLPVLAVLIHLQFFREIATLSMIMAEQKANTANTQTANMPQQIHSANDFDTILWPQLHQKLCPEGAPELGFATTLFDLARREVGIPADFNNFTASSPQKQTFVEYFFDRGFDFALFIDRNDPSNTLFFPKVWKCANNNVTSYLQDHIKKHYSGGSGKSTLQEITQYRSKKLFWRQVRRWTAKRGAVGIETPPYDDTSFFTIQNKEGKKIWYGKPCVFTNIRDPISHFLSGYNEAETQLITGEDWYGMKVRELEPSKRAPYAKVPYDSDEDMQQKRFKTLVRNLLQEHPSFRWSQYRHFFPMSRILNHLQRIDLLPRHNVLESLENLEERLPEFVAKSCPRFVGNAPKRRKLQSSSNSSTHKFQFNSLGHKSSNDPFGTYKGSKDVWKKGGPTARALCHLVAYDYGCFYDNDGNGTGTYTSLRAADIPSLCREVYSSEQFRNAILTPGVQSDH